MTLRERRVDDVTILDLKGRLVLEEGDAVLRSRVNELATEGRFKIIVNMKDVTYVDSCGIGVLIAKYVSLRKKGGDLKLLGLTPRSHRLMEISKLLNVFETFDVEDLAVRSFASR